MKKILILSLVTIVITANVNAQSMGSEYRTALGVKIYPGALSIKHFMQPDKAIEGLAYFYNDGFRLTGLYEIHGNIEGAEGLKWYVGPGAHIDAWNDSWKQNHPNKSGAALGIDGVLGLDYKFRGAPINMSLDWQPSFTFIGYNNFDAGWFGLGIRYTF
jgi:hypothetical protein